MPHLEIVASPAIFVMLLGCVLGVGFMVRFLVALTLDGRTAEDQTIRAGFLRPGRVHFAAGMACVETPVRPTDLGSAAQLAIGVMRITTALTSDAVGAKRQTSSGRLHVGTRDNPKREADFTAEPHYRSG